jgi:hypothetical protein
MKADLNLNLDELKTALKKELMEEIINEMRARQLRSPASPWRAIRKEILQSAARKGLSLNEAASIANAISVIVRMRCGVPRTQLIRGEQEKEAREVAMKVLELVKIVEKRDESEAGSETNAVPLHRSDSGSPESGTKAIKQTN